jgi:aldehyde dehydrogenase (NAD+)
MGDPTDPSTMLGPLADRKQFDRVMEYLERGKQEAKLVIGGGRKGDKGNFIEPTIFLDPSTDSRIYKEEIFGPVLVIKTFKTEEEAIELANKTSYGLAGKFVRMNKPLPFDKG